jgi:3-deoxy-D-arabino-heptulosonate 7-phosphate (DAHP) synthase
LVSELGSVDQERSTKAKEKKKKKKKKRRKKRKKKERCRKNMKRKKKSEKEETKMYSILKIFEAKGVAVEAEEMITVVEAVVKKGIMRRMGNQANKTRR